MSGGTAHLMVEFRSWWLAGTGGGRGRHLDAVCHRDADGLPAMPMSQIKGTLRETAKRLAAGELAGWTNERVDDVFGSESKAGAVAFLGDAEIPQKDRKGLTGPSNREKRTALFRRIAATQIDELGTAEDRTLRYVEAAAPVTLCGTLDWIAAEEPEFDWMALLDAACVATVAFGKLKLDGYGAAVASVTPAAAAAFVASRNAPAATATGTQPTHKVRLVLMQNRPAVFSRSAATEGAHATLGAPTGSALLGWAAAVAGYEKFGDPFKVFHSGAVRFGNAVPVGPDGTACVPMPKLLMAPKHESEGGVTDDGRIGDTVRIGRPQGKRRDGAPVQYEALDAPFVTETGWVKRPTRGQRLRTATKNGRAAEGQLFGYEHLSGQDRPVFESVLERDLCISEEDWKRLLTAFANRTLRLGRARGTGYGGEYECHIEEPRRETAGTIKAGENPGRLRILALSDLALADEFGTPSDVPDHKMLGLPKARFVGEDSAISLRRHAPWNAKLKARDMERQTIEAGSILTFDLCGPLDEDLPARAAVGLWREAGFGQIWIAPPFLQGCEKPCFSAAETEGSAPNGESEDGSDLAKWCDAMLTNRRGYQ